MIDKTNGVISHQPGPEELHPSETRYQRLFESARDGILILEGDSQRIIDMNPFAVELLGYSADECLGRELREIGLFKDQKESLIAFQELQDAGYVRRDDLQLDSKAGEPRTVALICNVYVEENRQLIQCNIRDIT